MPDLSVPVLILAAIVVLYLLNSIRFCASMSAE